jgi:hypothetical protein
MAIASAASVPCLGCSHRSAELGHLAKSLVTATVLVPL